MISAEFPRRNFLVHERDDLRGGRAEVGEDHPTPTVSEEGEFQRDRVYLMDSCLEKFGAPSRRRSEALKPRKATVENC